MTTIDLTSRRHFLRGMAFGLPVSIGLPTLDLLLNDNGDAYAQSGLALPKRFVVFFFGNGRGVEPERWNPADAGPNWEITAQLAPLAQFKDHLNVVSGTRIRLDNSPQGHHNGAAGVLRGADFITQPKGNAPFRSTHSGPTIDQIIAEHIGQDTPFRSLEVGIYDKVVRNEGTTLQFLSHNGPDNANPPEYDPRAVFDRLFTGAIPGADPGLIESATRMKRSVLDHVTEDLNGLKLRVGSSDKLRLDQHLENIRAIEQRLGAGSTAMAQCASPTPPLTADTATQRMQGMADMITLAFACNITRVASVLYSGGAAQHVFEVLGQSTGNHSISHEGAQGQAEIDASTIRTMEDFGLLLAGLDSSQEGSSTLLHQSACLVSSDTSNGSAHSITDYPILIAGGAGGALKTPGVHAAMDGTNTSTVLLSLVRAMGMEATEFGGGRGYVTESCTEIEA